MHMYIVIQHTVVLTLPPPRQRISIYCVVHENNDRAFATII